MAVKRENRNKVYAYIYKQGKTSRQEIAVNLGMSMPTVLQYTKELIEEGQIQEIGAYESTGGRKAKSLSIRPKVRTAVGLDLTKKHVSILLIDLLGNIIDHKRERKLFEKTSEYFGQLRLMVDDIISQNGISSEQILGIGVSVPGNVEEAQGKICNLHMLGLAELDFTEISHVMQYPCIFMNDANAAAVELKRQYKGNAVYLSLSDTVGGAVFIENRLYEGDNFRSAEIGHMRLVPEGRLCYCGKRGCVDPYCSALVLKNCVNADLETFFSCLEKKEEKCMKVWDEYLNDLALVIHNLRFFMDCNIILGGYVGSYLEPYLTEIRKRVVELGHFEISAEYIQTCSYKMEASALGAALQHIDVYLKNM